MKIPIAILLSIGLMSCAPIHDFMRACIVIGTLAALELFAFVYMANTQDRTHADENKFTVMLDRP